MDTIAVKRAINHAVGKGHDLNIREKLEKLLIERHIPYLSATDTIEFRKTIGSGIYGIVDLVYYRKRLYAHKKPLSNHPDKRNSVLDEAIKLTEITEYHPNIQQLSFINLKSLGFLIDYCDCGSLDKILLDKNFTYTLTDAINWGYQLADALSFLHSKNIMHRDVKVQNILLKDNYQTLVLTDYGTATQLGRSLLTNNVGTPVTMAPEVFTGTTYAEQCDIYSWSIVFWQLLSKQYSPYDVQKMTSFSLMMNISTQNLRPKELKNCPPLLTALLYRSWHPDPNERPTLFFIKQILRIFLNILPKSELHHSDDAYLQLKHQWLNEYNLPEKYLPSEARPDHEKSINLSHNHITKMKNIIEIKAKISKLKEQVKEYSKQNDARYDDHEALLKENELLQEQINRLYQQRPS